MHYKFGYGIDNQLILKICCNKHFLKIEIVFSFYSKINLKKKKINTRYDNRMPNDRSDIFLKASSKRGSSRQIREKTLSHKNKMPKIERGYLKNSQRYNNRNRNN